MQILGISGSIRRDSYNSRLLRAAAAALPPGAELELVRGAGVDPALQRGPRDRSAGRRCGLREQIAARGRAADQHSRVQRLDPGLLKNAIDWASRPFPDNALRDQPAAVIGASTGLFGAVWAQAEMRKVLRHAGRPGARRGAPGAHRRPGLHARRRLVVPELGNAWRPARALCA